MSALNTPEKRSGQYHRRWFTRTGQGEIIHLLHVEDVRPLGKIWRVRDVLTNRESTLNEHLIRTDPLSPLVGRRQTLPGTGGRPSVWVRRVRLRRDSGRGRYGPDPQ